MLPFYIKKNICQHLIEAESYKTLENLKRASKEWCYLVLSLQWHEYTIEVPIWFINNIPSCSVWPYKYPQDEYLSELFEYGRYFVKSVSLCMKNREVNKRYIGPFCPNLKSYTFQEYSNQLDIPKIIKQNPSITDISIIYRYDNGVELGISKLLTLNPQKLEMLEIVGRKVRIPTLTTFLEYFPNLRKVKIWDLILEDTSYIVDSNTAVHLARGLKQYPNIERFWIYQVYIPKSNIVSYPSSHITLGILGHFPNIRTLGIEGNQSELKYNKDRKYALFSQVAVPIFPLVHLAELEVENINSYIASNLKINCPNVRKLALSTYDDEENNSNTYEVMRIFSSSFPQLAQLKLNHRSLDNWSDETNYHFQDALFFCQSAEIRETMTDKDIRLIRETVNLSYQVPIIFNWVNLRELEFGTDCHFSPRTFPVLNQFRNLEKLRITLGNFDNIFDIKQTTTFGDNCESQIVNDKASNWFPRLCYFKVRFCSDFEYSADECVALINLFPAIRICDVYTDRKYKKTWDNIKLKSPNVLWSFNSKEY